VEQAAPAGPTNHVRTVLDGALGLIHRRVRGLDNVGRLVLDHPLGHTDAERDRGAHIVDAETDRRQLLDEGLDAVEGGNIVEEWERDRGSGVTDRGDHGSGDRGSGT